MNKFVLRLKNIVFAISFFVLGNTVVFAQVETNYGNNPTVGQYITINNINMYYEVYGTGKPILLIHGNKTGIKGWKTQIDYFSKKYKVYAVDCRGRGKTALGNDTLSYKQMADDLGKFIQLKSLDSIIIIGKSDGAIVALMMGMSNYKQIHKIIAYAANVKCDSTALFPHTINEIITNRKNADAMLKANDTDKDWKTEQQRYRMMEFQPNLTAKDLNKISVPVLVISTDRDVIKESHVFFIYTSLKFANLCIIPNETHKFPTQNPTLFNTIVDNYISTPFQTNLKRFE